MGTVFKNKHPARRLKSFHYAFSGILNSIFEEPNFRLQIIITLSVIFFGVLYSISTIEWALLTISLGLMLTAELMNTVIENFMDHLIQEHHEGVRVIKDVSAGFVLVAAITTLIIIFLVFGGKVSSSFIQ